MCPACVYLFDLYTHVVVLIKEVPFLAFNTNVWGFYSPLDVADCGWPDGGNCLWSNCQNLLLLVCDICSEKGPHLHTYIYMHVECMKRMQTINFSRAYVRTLLRLTLEQHVSSSSASSSGVSTAFRGASPLPVGMLSNAPIDCRRCTVGTITL